MKGKGAAEETNVNRYEPERSEATMWLRSHVGVFGEGYRDWRVLCSVSLEDKTTLFLGEYATPGALPVGMGLSACIHSLSYPVPSSSHIHLSVGWWERGSRWAVEQAHMA